MKLIYIAFTLFVLIKTLSFIFYMFKSRNYKSGIVSSLILIFTLVLACVYYI